MTGARRLQRHVSLAPRPAYFAPLGYHFSSAQPSAGSGSVRNHPEMGDEIRQVVLALAPARPKLAW
jgi:hypothetical protein